MSGLRVTRGVVVTTYADPCTGWIVLLVRNPS